MNNKLSHLIEDYQTYLELEKNTSIKTIENYSLWLRRFVDFSKDISPKEITPILVLKFRKHLKEFTPKMFQILLKKTNILKYKILTLEVDL